MAEGVGGSSKLLCRYFAGGACKEGSKCKFSHDFSNSKVDSVCRYYQKGNCFYGNNCRYDHVSLKSRNNNAQNKRPPPNSHEPRAHSSALGLNKDSPRKSSSPNDSHRMVVLKKMDQSGKSEASPNPVHNWLDAPEFVPRGPPKSYAAIVHPEAANIHMQQQQQPELCPFAMIGDCQFELCQYLHGNVCDWCNKPCLHPTDMEQQKQHREECMKEIERNMDHSFAMQRSSDKACGICMELVIEKEPPSERRFGILEKCSHIFCLTCIRQWRQTKSFESKNIRGCPECRVLSDFVTPSKYWVDDKDEKLKIIAEYKEAMSKKSCKYFKQGTGTCPFAGACFYSHVDADGKKVELAPPRPRHRRNQNGDVSDINHVFLWEFFDMRDEMLERLEELEWGFLSDLSDSDDSDSGEFQLVF